MPGTHRTPPDAAGARLTVAAVPTGVRFLARDPRQGHAQGAAVVEVTPDALPALVVALAAHLSDIDRLALAESLGR